MTRCGCRQRCCSRREQPRLAAALFAGSRYKNVELHINKGLAFAPAGGDQGGARHRDEPGRHRGLRARDHRRRRGARLSGHAAAAASITTPRSKDARAIDRATAGAAQRSPRRPARTSPRATTSTRTGSRPTSAATTRSFWRHQEAVRPRRVCSSCTTGSAARRGAPTASRATTAERLAPQSRPSVLTTSTAATRCCRTGCSTCDWCATSRSRWCCSRSRSSSACSAMSTLSTWSGTTPSRTPACCSAAWAR